MTADLAAATPSTVGELLRRQALLQPDREAFVWLAEGEEATAAVTYSELDRRACQIARHLLGEGLAGQPVLLARLSGPDLAAALFGSLYAGSLPVIVPLPASRSLSRVGPLAKDSSAGALICDTALLESADERTGWPGTLRVFPAEHCETGCADAVGIEASPDAIALLQYTSGSTSSPRGVMLSHANILANVKAIARAANLPEGATLTSWLPLAHDMGLFGFVLFPLFAGLRSVLMPPHAFLKRPARWLDAISAHRAAVSAGPTFAYDLCIRAIPKERCAQWDLSCWRIAVCGGESVRADVIEGFVQRFSAAGLRRDTIRPAYGLAETGVLAASPAGGIDFVTRAVDGDALALGKVAAPAVGSRTRTLVSCGSAHEGHELLIVDPERHTRLEAGMIGEIWLRGPSVARGYFGRPEETAATFRAVLCGAEEKGAWLRTGDLGFIAPEGLMITGRRKDLIIVHGMNIDPQDLELAAAAGDEGLQPGGGAAFSIDDDGPGERVVLAQELTRAGLRNADMAALIDRITSAVNLQFGISLHDLVLVRPGALPRTTSGKIQRHLCRELYTSGALASVVDTRHLALGRFRGVKP